MVRQHRNQIAYPKLWNIVDGAIRSAMAAHPEFEISTSASLTKRVVGQLLTQEARTVFLSTVETD
jgi:hypothetical protein